MKRTWHQIVLTPDDRKFLIGGRGKGKDIKLTFKCPNCKGNISVREDR